MKKPARNGKIDLLRFVFCIGVILHHIELILGEDSPVRGYFTLGRQGYIGVEFFFLVSGWLLARKLASLDARPHDLDTLGGETYRFLWSKLKPVLPYHLIFSASMLVLWGICYPKAFGDIVLARIPTLFFLHRIGITGAEPKDIMGIEWYVFSMVLGMALLYPLGRRYKRTFRSLAPIAGLLICGYLMIETGCLGNVDHIVGFTYKCNWRAVGDLMIGMGCYEATCALDRKTFSRWGRLLLAALEIACFCLVWLYICGSLDQKYDMYALVLLAVGVTLAFSGKGVGAGWKLFASPVFAWLGGISLPVYLAQAPFLSFVPVFMKGADKGAWLWVMLLGPVICGILTHFLVTVPARRSR